MSIYVHGHKSGVYSIQRSLTPPPPIDVRIISHFASLTKIIIFILVHCSYRTNVTNKIIKTNDERANY